MGSQASVWENHGETVSMEHSDKKAGWEDLGAESRAGSGRQPLVKPWQVPTAGQLLWLRDFIEDCSPDICEVG